MIKICPSLMCADFTKLKDEILELERAGADMFHLDIMDGNFVPNFALGIEDVKAVSKIASIPYDIHLMIEEPERYVEKFSKYGCKIMYVHLETCKHISRTLLKIKERNVKAGLALNPGTPISFAEEVLSDVEYILIMAVNPGFAGQSFIESTVDKVSRLKDLIDKKGYDIKIAVDGCINEVTVKKLYNVGAEYFIAGTAGLFNKNGSYSENINRLKNIL
ncbi:ribulose-phosphate 3-epimerase [Thermoanaerobacterium thermosaccharolyticum]|uniref:Ribulose-phosphate 3-epimerase n=1 Tax=Thermoanaerobacterium thermosaccharolyticum TaxID=1517 RepID=A0A231VC41_THETR|nr:ribulose-phosphate 3-epimerase [Thermoanaerobacterium thermosaccharolyticum]OXT05732.1 ribulose-phosphate 3-epimerase [Thermoanaerobacterium thermosaccharolyticum]